jgi:hypothetical protein
VVAAPNDQSPLTRRQTVNHHLDQYKAWQTVIDLIFILSGTEFYTFAFTRKGNLLFPQGGK